MSWLLFANKEICGDFSSCSHCSWCILQPTSSKEANALQPYPSVERFFGLCFSINYNNKFYHRNIQNFIWKGKRFKGFLGPWVIGNLRFSFLLSFSVDSLLLESSLWWWKLVSVLVPVRCPERGKISYLTFCLFPSFSLLLLSSCS